jgi:hypothetical protein
VASLGNYGFTWTSKAICQEGLKLLCLQRTIVLHELYCTRMKLAHFPPVRSSRLRRQKMNAEQTVLVLLAADSA